MLHYYVSAIAAAVISFLITGFMVRYASQRQLFMPAVRARDVHKMPVARVGGIAVVLSFLILVVYWQIYRPAVWNFTGQTLLGFDRNLIGVILAVILLSIVNFLDDRKSLPVWLRLLTQTAAAALIVAFGIKINWLTNPLGGHWYLGIWEWLFVIIWLVGLSNVVNWLDGVDGLASGVGAIALAILFYLSISPTVAQKENALLAAVAFGSLLGFLPYNIGLTKLRAFLGDTGSVFLGFIIGVIAIISGGKVATAFLVLAIPFLDAVVVVISRIIHRQSPFVADKRHLHHRLLELGLKSWQIVIIFYAVTFVFGLIALNTQSIGKLRAAIASAILMALLVGLYTFIGHRKGNHK